MLNIFRDTAGHLIVLIGFLLDDVHDVINRNTAQQHFLIIHYGQHDQVVLLHDLGYFLQRGTHVDGAHLALLV